MNKIKKTDLRKYVFLGLLLAIEIILTRFCSVTTPIVRIGFGFVPIAVAAYLYGPMTAGLTYAAGDFIGAMLFPVGAFFPGFTLTAFCTGLAFGLLLHDHKFSLLRTITAALGVSVGFNWFLDTLWVCMLAGSVQWDAYTGMLITRIFKPLFMFPVQFIVIRLVVTSPITRLGAYVSPYPRP